MSAQFVDVSKHNGKPAGGMLHPVVVLRDAIERAGGAASERTLLWAFKFPGTTSEHLRHLNVEHRRSSSSRTAAGRFIEKAGGLPGLIE